VGSKLVALKLIRIAFTSSCVDVSATPFWRATPLIEIDVMSRFCFFGATTRALRSFRKNQEQGREPFNCGGSRREARVPFLKER
jgi:hypothetical protein